MFCGNENVKATKHKVMNIAGSCLKLFFVFYCFLRKNLQLKFFGEKIYFFEWLPSTKLQLVSCFKVNYL